MKRSGVVLLTFFLLGAQLSFCQEKNKETLIRKIFSVLADKDEQGFINLFPDAATIKSFLAKSFTRDTSGADDGEIKAYLAAMNDSMMQADLKDDFDKYIRIGENHGVDWDKARFVSFTADSALVEEDGMKVPMLRGKIYFNVEADKFFLAYDEVIWFDNKGWYGVNINRIDLKRRENEGEDFDWDGEIADSTLLLMDSVVAVSTVADTMMTVITEDIHGAKNKPNKQPAKNKAAKTKNKSPIRKPE